MHREEGVSWGHLQEKGHRRHMEVGEGEGDNQGVDSVEHDVRPKYDTLAPNQNHKKTQYS